MMFQERAIPKESLEKFLLVLDSDEGIRIDNDNWHIFVNKASKRYCINISKGNKDEFVYKDNAVGVTSFLKDYINDKSKIFAY